MVVNDQPSYFIILVRDYLLIQKVTQGEIGKSILRSHSLF
jgi:hypothetical protein